VCRRYVAKIAEWIKIQATRKEGTDTPWSSHFSRKYRPVVHDGCPPTRPMRKRFLTLRKIYPGESFFTVKHPHCVLASLPRSETRDVICCWRWRRSVLSTGQTGFSCFRVESTYTAPRSKVPSTWIWQRTQRIYTWRETANRPDAPFNFSINSKKLHF